MHFGLFGSLTKLGAKGAKVVQKFVPRSRIGIFGNERTRSTPLDPKLMFWCVSYYSEFFTTNAPDQPHWTLNSSFVAFRTIWVHLGPFGCLRNSVQIEPNKCKSLCHEVASEFFATNAPDPPRWTLNSCFVAFRTIWVHLGLFGCLTKLVQNGPN